MTRPAEQVGNPCLNAWDGSRPGSAPAREELLRRFGFAVPDDAALQAIVDHSPHGVVELGAGLV